MKKLTGFLTTLFAILAIFLLASCNDTSNVQVQMSSIATTKSITMNFTFAANDKITNGSAQPHVKYYTYDEEASDNIGYFKQDTYLVFSDTYTSSSATFDSLDMDTKYVFRLYVTYNQEEELIETWVLSTKSGVATDIVTKDQLLDITNDPSGSYVLKADLDFAGETITAALFSDSNRFTGTFDGDGHTISNFKYSSSVQGLFAYTDGATIKNLTLVGHTENELVNGDYTSTQSTKDLGLVAGNAKGTLFENVSVKDASIEVNGGASATLNVGAFVGYADGCQFVNCKAENVSVKFAKLRNRVCTGLFAGAILGNVKVKTDDKTFTVKNCFATGVLEGVLHFASNVGAVYVGGFAGDISSSALVTDSYTVCDIDLYRDETSSYSNEFSLSVGSFAGGKVNGTSMYITKCAAVADILVQAGAKDTSLEVDAMKELELNQKYTYVGGFIGEISEYINKIENCVACKKADGIVINALESKVDSETSQTITLITKANDVAKKYDTAKIINVVYAQALADFDTTVLASNIAEVLNGYLA
ncbi:MAG: hypothetical protein K6B64_00335 [Acholeplasmatales bacterium]|nr:hypothetical protein [Acholeplasmatales bacterium]